VQLPHRTGLKILLRIAFASRHDEHPEKPVRSNRPTAAAPLLVDCFVASLLCIAAKRAAQIPS
jgi:hypothetical protein